MALAHAKVLRILNRLKESTPLSVASHIRFPVPDPHHKFK